jgi:copper chaperone NosL
MRRTLILLSLLTLAACKEEALQDVAPVALDERAVGHFCQMELLEHEGPKAQVHLGGLPGAPLFFSQTRDAVAYARMPEQSHEILAIWVNDMGAPDATWTDPGAENWIEADAAHYVVGAAVTGGMGAPEIVPFADFSAAEDFARANGGLVMSLDDIPDDAVLAPVDLAAHDADSDFERRLRALSRRAGD